MIRFKYYFFKRYNHEFVFQSNVVANYILCFLLGGKDRRGGPIIAFPAKTRAVELDRTSLTRLLVYLASIPRFAEFF